MRGRTATLVITLLVLARAAPARQGVFETVRSDAEHFFDDLVDVWTSPFRWDHRTVPALIALGEAMLLTGFTDGEVQGWIEEHPNSLAVRALTPFRDSSLVSKFGYTSGLLSFSGVLYGAGLAFDSDALREAGVGCATANVSTTLARHAIARLVGRMRPMYGKGPYVFKPFAFGDWAMRSFPGGHGANLMACATYLNHRFDLGVIEPVLYVLSAAIGFGRVLDGAHWTSDTVFALVFGWAVGRAIAERFDERSDRDDAVVAGPGARHPHPAIVLRWRIPL